MFNIIQHFALIKLPSCFLKHKTMIMQAKIAIIIIFFTI